jgi:DNA-binding MurR/RpiR family transcriptional regulator
MRRVATYIVDHHKEAVFLNASTLAKNAGVSETTVTRLTYKLDFKGFPQLKEALQDHARTFLSLPRYEPGGAGSYMLGEVAAMEKSIIDETLVSIPPELFESAVGLLHQARRIVVVGTHYNSVPAAYAAYFLSATRPSISLIKSVDIDVFSRTMDCGPQDVVLAVSTARYPKDTHRIVESLKARGTPVIAVTDSAASPVAPLADLVLVVPMRFISFIDPFAGVLVLLHALTTAVYVRNGGEAKRCVQDFNDFMRQHDYNTVAEINLFELL